MRQTATFEVGQDKNRYIRRIAERKTPPRLSAEQFELREPRGEEVLVHDDQPSQSN